MRATLTDAENAEAPGGTGTDVTVTINAVASHVRVPPSFIYIPAQVSHQFAALVLDQWGRVMPGAGPITWEPVVGGGGTVDSATGMFTAGGTPWGRNSVIARLGAGGPRGSATVDLTVNSSISDRRVFYNNSAFDGYTPGPQAPLAGANNDDDDALAPNTEPSPDPNPEPSPDPDPATEDPNSINRKVALRPGQTATRANYTSYAKGLNGIMVDLSWLPNGPEAVSAADFAFKAGNDLSPGGWAAAPAPTSVTARELPSGSYRVTMIWADEAIKNKWLQVTVKPTAYTGLALPDVFYFGNLVGESYIDAATGRINAFDSAETRRHWGETATIANLYDHNRDGSVGSADSDIVTGNLGATIALLVAPPA